jgi:GNAT superfamily N-acetyltransferase
MPIYSPSLPERHAFRDLRFREAAVADSALIASMHAQSWIAAYRGMLPDAFLDREAHGERAAHWQARMPALCAGAGRVLIAEHEGAPVGFVCMIAPDAAGSVLIDNLHALPGFRGLGAGRAMLSQATAWARERGACAMHLHVLETNAAAIGFYELLGWKRVAREADSIGGAEVFALRYVLALT